MPFGLCRLTQLKLPRNPLDCARPPCRAHSPPALVSADDLNRGGGPCRQPRLPAAGIRSRRGDDFGQAVALWQRMQPAAGDDYFLSAINFDEAKHYMKTTGGR